LFIYIKATEKAGPIVELEEEEEELPPIRTFMDDLTLLRPRTEAIEAILCKVEQLMDWVRMYLKTKNLSALYILGRGKLTGGHFTLLW
jgi:hypothetical protein